MNLSQTCHVILDEKEEAVSHISMVDLELLLERGDRSVVIAIERGEGGEGGGVRKRKEHELAHVDRVHWIERCTRTPHGLRDAGKLIGILTVLLRRGGLFRTG